MEKRGRQHALCKYSLDTTTRLCKSNIVIYLRTNTQFICFNTRAKRFFPQIRHVYVVLENPDQPCPSTEDQIKKTDYKQQ